MRNPSGGAPAEGQGERNGEMVSIDEKPVRRCARHVVEIENRRKKCPSMRNPSGGAPGAQRLFGAVVLLCPSMRNPSGGAPTPEAGILSTTTILCPSMRNPSGGAPEPQEG